MPSPDELPPAVPAATVVVVRDRAEGIETLMLRRSGHGAFAGHWVFPGGKVDDADRHDDGHGDGDEVSWARRAAVREAREEAGIKLGLDDLVVFSHWMPPPIQPKRFSTWFFAAAAPNGVAGDVTIDGHEIHEHAWIAAADAIARRDQGELELAPPTWITLHQVASHGDVAAFTHWAKSEPPRRFHSRSTKIDGVLTLLWEGDAGYESGDHERAGDRNRLAMAPDGWRYHHERAGR